MIATRAGAVKALSAFLQSASVIVLVLPSNPQVAETSPHVHVSPSPTVVDETSQARGKTLSIHSCTAMSCAVEQAVPPSPTVARQPFSAAKTAGRPAFAMYSQSSTPAGRRVPPSVVHV